MKLIKYFITYIIYIAFLMICYIEYVIKAYGYYGFKNNISSSSTIISILVLLISFIYVYKQKSNSYSKLIIYILFLVNFIPSVITYYFMPIGIKYLLLQICYWTIAIISINFLNKMHISSKNKKFKSNILNIYIFLLIELITISIVLFKYTGLNLNFKDIYEMRNNYFITNIPTILAYLYSAFKVVNPLLFSYLYSKKNKIGWLLSVLVQFFAFLADGSKSTFFSLLLAYIIIRYINKIKIKNYLENDNFKFYILLGITSINVIGFLEFFIFNSSILYNYFIRRLFFIPSLLHQYYYDYFSVNAVDMFKQSILGKVGYVSQYTKPIPQIIGEVYFYAPTMRANNGLFSDAYMNLGAFGSLIMPIFLSIALRFFDYTAKHINPYYLIPVLVSITYTFISSSFFTVLMTHGYLLLCLIVLIIIPKDVEKI